MKNSMKHVLVTFVLSMIIAMTGIAIAEDELLLPVA